MATIKEQASLLSYSNYCYLYSTPYHLCVRTVKAPESPEFFRWWRYVLVKWYIYFGVFGHFCCRNFELDEDFSIELSFGKKYCSLYHDKACVSSDTFTVLSFYLALFFTSRYLYALYPIDTRLQTSLHLTAFVLVHCKYSTRLWLLT